MPEPSSPFVCKQKSSYSNDASYDDDHLIILIQYVNFATNLDQNWYIM